jgi:hypothetical protein
MPLAFGISHFTRESSFKLAIYDPFDYTQNLPHSTSSGQALNEVEGTSFRFMIYLFLGVLCAPFGSAQGRLSVALIIDD